MSESAIIMWRRVYRSHGIVGIWACTFHQGPSQLASGTVTVPTFDVHIFCVISSFWFLCQKTIHWLFYLPLPSLLFHSPSLEWTEDKDFQSLWRICSWRQGSCCSVVHSRKPRSGWWSPGCLRNRPGLNGNCSGGIIIIFHHIVLIAPSILDLH